MPRPSDLDAVDASPVRCLDEVTGDRMVAEIDRVRKARDTVGGVFEVLAYGCPPGLGSHVHHDRKLDARLALALMSIQSVKGVEVGDGFATAARLGFAGPRRDRGRRARSGAPQRPRGRHRGRDDAPAQPIRVRAAMKPFSTVPQPLATVDLRTGKAAVAIKQRTDVCAVPAGAVVGEAAVAYVLADAVLEKFGGDSLAETRRNLESFVPPRAAGARVIIYLVGMPGSGKSTVGPELARRLGVPFVELDAEIERAAGMTVRGDLRSRTARRAFRELEAAALTEAVARDPSVVSCGGGVVLEPANRVMLRASGEVVFLSAPLEVLERRVRPGEDRPLDRGSGDLERLFREREPLYREFAAHVVDASGTVGRGGGGDRGRAAALERVTVAVSGRDYAGRRGARRCSRPPASTFPISTGRSEPSSSRTPASRSGTSRRWSRVWPDAGSRRVHLGVPEGEEAKSLQVMTALQRQLATQEAHRDDLVVALGGGAVGDLAGFVAATYMRGVPFVQVPTTLTAMVDAAIGGKTAVNLPEGKNLVGAFHQPVAVLADVAALSTLPEREYRSGLAEVAKYGLTLDLELLDQLEGDPSPVLRRDPAALEPLVARCVRAKAALVEQDERDTGRRLFLNYGHTLGHALERLDAFGGRSHGEAISVGMVFAARLAESLGRAPSGLAARHVRLLSSLGLETDGPLPGAGEILDAFRMDKKYRSGVRFVLLEDVGRPVVVDSVPEDLLRETLAGVGAGT